MLLVDNPRSCKSQATTRDFYHGVLPVIKILHVWLVSRTLRYWEHPENILAYAHQQNDVIIMSYLCLSDNWMSEFVSYVMFFLPHGTVCNGKETQTQRIMSKLNQGMFNFTFNHMLTCVSHCPNPLSLTGMYMLCFSRKVRIHLDVRVLILLRHYAVFHK